MFEIDSQPPRCRELHPDAVPSPTKFPPLVVRWDSQSRAVRSVVQTKLCATTAWLAFWLRESGRVKAVLTIYWTFKMSFYNYSSGDLGTRLSYRGGIPGIGNERGNVFLCVRAASDGPVFLCGCPKRPKSETRLSCRLSTTPRTLHSVRFYERFLVSSSSRM